jgi:serine/threonine-protein kinase LATS1/2
MGEYSKNDVFRQKESKYLRMKRQKMNKEMFEMIRHIGIGAFGKVTLVRKWDTDQVYAMKTLVKADVIQVGKNDDWRIQKWGKF